MPADVSEEHVTSIFTAEECAKQETRMKQVASTALLLGLLFSPEDGGDMSLRNAG
jgi:hypothetical protein